MNRSLYYSVFRSVFWFIYIFKNIQIDIKIKARNAESKKKRYCIKSQKKMIKELLGKINCKHDKILVIYKFQLKLLTYYYIKFHLTSFT